MDRRELLHGLGALALSRCGVKRLASYSLKESSRAPYFVQYVRGNYLITLGMPRLAYAALPGEFAWFGGMNAFPTGEILLRMSGVPDGGDEGTGNYIVSADGGNTFDPATKYSVLGRHGADEVLVMGADGSLRGGCFRPFRRNPADPLRSVQCDYQTISNGGRTCVLDTWGVTISGFPLDISDFNDGSIGCSWPGNAIKLSETHWLATFSPQYVGHTRIWCSLIETFDSGRTWTWKCHVNTEIFDDGLDEPCLNFGPGGVNDLVVISRTGGSAPVARARSLDGGATNFTVETNNVNPALAINAWAKSPHCAPLANGDFALTTGVMQPNASEPYVHGAAPARMGLYVAPSIMSNGWAVADLIEHHNSVMPDAICFKETNQSTGYTTWVPLPGGTATRSNILINYDQSLVAYGSNTRQYVVNAQFERLS